MALNAHFWDNYFRRVYCAEVEMYTQVIRERLLPAFGNIDEEATQIADDEFNQQISQSPDYDSFDPGDAADNAFNKGLVFYELISGVRQSMLNVAAVHLHHLFEQHLFAFYRRELLTPHEELEEESKQREYSLDKVKKRLLQNSIDVTTFASWQKVDELRLVANTAKHGEGKSAKQLKPLRPDMFIHPQLRENSQLPTFGPGSADRPLSGNDFFVTIEDFKEYSNTVLLFWEELSNKMLEL